MHSFDFTRLAILDNIELFSSENEHNYFPFHFHDYYCVSLITSGTELLHNTRLGKKQQFYTSAIPARIFIIVYLINKLCVL